MRPSWVAAWMALKLDPPPETKTAILASGCSGSAGDAGGLRDGSAAAPPAARLVVSRLVLLPMPGADADAASRPSACRLPPASRWAGPGLPEQLAEHPGAGSRPHRAGLCSKTLLLLLAPIRWWWAAACIGERPFHYVFYS